MTQENPYTYIFVRQDLRLPQQIVQASHAALEAGFRFQKPEETSFIVLIGAKNEQELHKIAKHLSRHEIEFEMFFEPDYDTGYTAIATQPLYGDQRKCLRKYQLFQGEANG